MDVLASGPAGPRRPSPRWRRIAGTRVDRALRRAAGAPGVLPPVAPAGPRGPAGPGGEPGGAPAADGPVRPAAPGGARWRRAGTALAVLAAVGVVAVLRSGAEPVGESVASGPPAPAGVPSPPFDRLPGRTPIPEPTHAGWFLTGTLPPLGRPARQTAERAASLVLGRYCARPDRYAVTFGQEGDWRSVEVFAFGLDRGGDPPGVRLRLDWTGGTYRWTGTPVQLSTC